MEAVGAPIVLGVAAVAVFAIIAVKMTEKPKHSYSDGLAAGRRAAEAEQAANEEQERNARLANEEQERNARLNYPVPDWLEVGRGVFNIAFTGPSGSGKSSLINALRRVRTIAEGAARTGVTETTMQPARYLLFDLGGVQVFLWDLPGGNTTTFPPDTYIQEMGLQYFDVVVIVTSFRPTPFDHSLQQEMERQTRPLPYKLVRTTVDVAIRNEATIRDSPEEEVMEGVLGLIRADLARQFPGTTACVRFKTQTDTHTHTLHCNICCCCCCCGASPWEVGRSTDALLVGPLGQFERCKGWLFMSWRWVLVGVSVSTLYPSELGARPPHGFLQRTSLSRFTCRIVLDTGCPMF